MCGITQLFAEKTSHPLAADELEREGLVLQIQLGHGPANGFFRSVHGCGLQDQGLAYPVVVDDDIVRRGRPRELDPFVFPKEAAELVEVGQERLRQQVIDRLAFGGRVDGVEHAVPCLVEPLGKGVMDQTALRQGALKHRHCAAWLYLGQVDGEVLREPSRGPLTARELL